MSARLIPALLQRIRGPRYFLCAPPYILAKNKGKPDIFQQIPATQVQKAVHYRASRQLHRSNMLLAVFIPSALQGSHRARARLRHGRGNGPGETDCACGHESGISGHGRLTHHIILRVDGKITPIRHFRKAR
ncbi:hypothetical protein [Delftia sp. PS-11]|uniref:hypothetical protein n=1 Tax=Delftia sp. PS-11 TaxID=2767222 RepID=UPI00245483C7|nr:hypothetical protein [Delftia sp. PS-11]KAJ8743583.1 hypothetical protein H9T68_16340 [Delftia sp. PS-11]